MANNKIVLLALSLVSFGTSSRAVPGGSGDQDAAHTAVARSMTPAIEDVSLGMCSGEGTVAVAGVKQGETLSPDRAKSVAGELMKAWRRSQSEARLISWETDLVAHMTVASAGRSTSTPGATLAAQTAEPSQPTKFTPRDLEVWRQEEKEWIDEGYKAFHDAKALGGTIGISCDMCHPDATNTHPETYPKFQSQMKKVALLRDMINWCIENPMKGKALPENDPALRSVEAYILSSRRGTALEPGKH